MSDNHFLARGKTYLLRIEVPEDLDEEKRMAAERAIYGEVLKTADSKQNIPGVDIVCIYRSNMDIAEVVNTAHEVIIKTLKDAVTNFNLEEVKA